MSGFVQVDWPTIGNIRNFSPQISMTQPVVHRPRPITLQRTFIVAILVGIYTFMLPVTPVFADSGSGGGNSGNSGNSGSNGGSGGANNNSGKGNTNVGNGGDDNGGDGGKGKARDGVRRGDVLPVGRILASARHSHPCQILSLTLRTSGSVLIYDVKLLDAAGNVVTVQIDAWTAIALGTQGADDYLPKPFHFDELIARIRAIIRRSVGEASPVLRSGKILLDTRTMRVSSEGRPLSLTPLEYRLLDPAYPLSSTRL